MRIKFCRNGKQKHSNNAGIVNDGMSIVFLLLFCLVCLTGCRSGTFSGKGTYVSETDANRKVTFRNRDDVGIFNGTVTYENGNDTLQGFYFVDDSDYGMYIFVSFPSAESDISSFLLVDGKLHTMGSPDEVFAFDSFVLSLWENHKAAVIIGFVVLGIIGVVHEKVEEIIDFVKDKTKDKNDGK